MKKFMLLCLAFWLAAPVTAEEMALESGSRVTLNWNEFNKMWQTLHSLENQVHQLTTPKNTPPVPYTLTRAAYRGEVGKQQTSIQAIFEIDVYETEKWVKVPFLPSSVAIDSLKLDGQSPGILEENGYHTLLVRRAGHHTLEARLLMKSPGEDEAPQLSFLTANTPITYLALRFPRPHLDVTIQPSQGMQSVTEGHQTLVTASIPPTNNIEVHWQKAAPVEVAGPSKIYVAGDTLLTVSEASLRAQSQFTYSILHHSIRELRIRVPENWNVLSVSCEGLQEWKMVSGKEGGQLLIHLAYAKKGDLVVSVQTEKVIAEKNSVIDVARLIPLDVEREQGAVGIEARGSVELQVQESAGLNPIDPQELPRAVWNGASQPILFAFRYTKAHSLAIAVKRHPEVPVLTTTVDNANAVTLFTERGQMITQVRYQVRNNLKQFLAVRLPEGSQLWSAFVAGQPVKPTVFENGSFRIPLAKSYLEAQGQQGFTVDLVYYTPIPRFLAFGQRATFLPIPDAPVSRALWSVYFPKNYRPIHFGGDLEQSETSLSAAMGFTQVSRDELKEVDTKGGRGDRFRSVRAMAKNIAPMAQLSSVNEAVDKQEDLAMEFIGAKSPTVAGVYPVAFDIPASGQFLNFGQVMLVDKSPSLSIWYVHAALVRMLMFGLLAMLLAGLYTQRNRLMTLVVEMMQRVRTFRAGFRAPAPQA